MMGRSWHPESHVEGLPPVCTTYFGPGEMENTKSFCSSLCRASVSEEPGYDFYSLICFLPSSPHPTLEAAYNFHCGKDQASECLRFEEQMSMPFSPELQVFEPWERCSHRGGRHGLHEAPKGGGLLGPRSR
ncbi:Pms1 Protein-like 1 [Manis pentadactyla]|nr:Pms1 Protein-like 1 [Manis pentadactyla]